MGAETIEVNDIGEFKRALRQARKNSVTTVIKIETDKNERIGSYESWWDVPVAEVSTMESVSKARAEYENSRKLERYHL